MSRTNKKSRRRRDRVLEFSDAETSALDQYLRDVSEHSLLTAEEEIRLAREARSGDERAMQELVNGNLRFVISVAKKYQNRGVALTDLIQEGNVGLLIAARKFDPDHGVKFISYAVWWIRQAIMSALAHQGRAVRVPLNRAAELSKIFRSREDLKRELRREPTAEEIGRRLSMDPDTVQLLLALNAGEVRLDAPVGDTDESRIIERFIHEEAQSAEGEVEERLREEEVQKALDTLRPRDARVLRLYYGLGGEREHTLEEIGQILGITRERVRQLRDRALRELREGEKADALASFAA
ncbi:MAG: sigma-70 family RNA polymerase sigma factor [Gemmatimonadota bacterium]